MTAGRASIELGSVGVSVDATHPATTSALASPAQRNSVDLPPASHAWTRVLFALRLLGNRGPLRAGRPRGGVVGHVVDDVAWLAVPIVLTLGVTMWVCSC